MRLASAGEAPGGRDRDRQRAGAHDRGQDEVAQRRDVDDVDEHRAALGVLVDADVDVGVVRRGDRDERRARGPPVSYSRRIHSIEPSAASASSSGTACGETSTTRPSQASRPSTFSSPIVTAADDDAAAAGELQAGDVERRLQHALHAGLIADPAPELTDAFLACIGLSWHPAYTVQPGSGAPDELLHRRLDGPPGPSRVRGRPRRPAHAAAAGHASGRVRGLLRPHRRARRALPSAWRAPRR